MERFNRKTMGKRLEGFRAVKIVDETTGFGLKYESSAKERMLEDVEEMRSFMKILKSRGR